MVLLVPSICCAQFFGQFGPLASMGPGQKSLGAYLGAGNNTVGPSAEFRFNYANHMTAGIQGTLERSVFGAQGDLRAGLLGTGGDFPLELGGQVAGGMVTGEGATSLYVQGVPGLSYEWDAGAGQTFSAWAGLGLRITTSTKALGSSESIFRLGGRFQFSSELGMAADLEAVDGTTRLMVGADYRFGGGGGSSNVPTSP